MWTRRDPLKKFNSKICFQCFSWNKSISPWLNVCDQSHGRASCDKNKKSWVHTSFFEVHEIISTENMKKSLARSVNEVNLMFCAKYSKFTSSSLLYCDIFNRMNMENILIIMRSTLKVAWLKSLCTKYLFCYRFNFHMSFCFYFFTTGSDSSSMRFKYVEVHNLLSLSSLNITYLIIYLHTVFIYSYTTFFYMTWADPTSFLKLGSGWISMLPCAEQPRDESHETESKMWPWNQNSELKDTKEVLYFCVGL